MSANEVDIGNMMKVFQPLSSIQIYKIQNTNEQLLLALQAEAIQRPAVAAREWGLDEELLALIQAMDHQVIADLSNLNVLLFRVTRQNPRVCSDFTIEQIQYFLNQAVPEIEYSGLLCSVWGIKEREAKQMVEKFSNEGKGAIHAIASNGCFAFRPRHKTLLWRRMLASLRTGDSRTIKAVKRQLFMVSQ